MERTEVVVDYKVLYVSSVAFQSLGRIPTRYTCEGDNINPPLDISELPERAKSLVVKVEDPDAPGGNWLHWIVWNIPPTHHIRENDAPGKEGLNDFGKIGYGGPCPPSGTHRYVFKVYGLDTLLELQDGARLEKVEEAMRDHIIAYGELIGVYKKSTD